MHKFVICRAVLIWSVNQYYSEAIGLNDFSNETAFELSVLKFFLYKCLYIA